MYDKELLTEIFKQISWSLDQITKRFQSVASSGDLIEDDAGLEKLDSICMQLIHIGEALKEVDKLTNGNFLPNYPEIDWKKVKGMRDILTHHYFDVDAEIIYTVYTEHLPKIKQVINKILKGLQCR